MREHPLPDRLRAQLLALGVPAPKHVPEALARFFPSEFNMSATGLGAEDLAEVLLYLVEKKVISIR